MRDKILAKVLRWLIFTIGVSLLPLVVNYRDVFMHSLGTPNFGVVTEHGEIYLLSSAFCATSIGELFGSSAGAAKTKIAAGGLAVILVIFCVFSYVGGSKNIPASKAEIDVTTQFLALIASVVLSTGCIAVSEVP